MPHLIGDGGLVRERVGRLDHEEGRAGDPVVRLQQVADRGLGDEIALAIGQAYGQLARLAKVWQTGREDCSTSRMISSFSGAGISCAVLPGPIVAKGWPAPLSGSF